MNEFIEKLIGRLEEKRKSYFKTFFEYGLNTDLGREDGLKESIKIVKELAEEHNGGWIPVSERLPEDRQRCLTTARIYVVPDHVDEPDNYIGVELNTYSKKYGWLENPEVIAWQPLPEPYQSKGE